jgi:O-antigen/teichoic acid export membrane protein
LASRASWNFLDQALSSLSNFLLSIIVARSLDADGYGAFALAFSVYAFTLTLSRYLVNQPLTIRFSAAGRSDFDMAARQCLNAALLMGGVVGVLSVSAGLLVGGPLGAALVVTGALLPGLLVQDAYRTIFFTVGRASAAALNDGVWALLMIAALLLVGILNLSSPVNYIWAWGLSAWSAAVLGGLQTRIWPMARRDVWIWFKAHLGLTRYSVTEVVVIVGSTQFTLMGTAAIGGLSVVGALRGAQVLTAPSVILSASVLAFVVPELARRPSIAGKALRKAALQISAVSVVLMAIWCSLVLLLPDRIGLLLLGETWDATSAILWPTVIGVVVGVASLGASSAVYAREGMRVMFGWVLIAGPVCLVAGLTGVAFGGAFGAAVGLAATAAYQSAVSWVRLRKISREAQTAL